MHHGHSHDHHRCSTGTKSDRSDRLGCLLWAIVLAIIFAACWHSR